MYTIEIENLGEIQKLFRAMPEVVNQELIRSVKKAGALILATEKNEAPIKSGTLRRGIGMEYFNIGVRIGPSSGYAVFVHNGTGLFGERHDWIRPKTAKVLAFKVGGKMVFTKRVAGQKPNPFVERTATKMKNPVNDVFDECLDNIIKKL